MINIKTLFAGALLSTVAAVSFAQAPAAPGDAGASTAVTAPYDAASKPKHHMKKHHAKKHHKVRHHAKRHHKTSAANKADSAAPMAPASR